MFSILSARNIAFILGVDNRKKQYVEKGFKKLHGGFYETIWNEQYYKMQMKVKQEMATIETIWNNINPLKGMWHIEKWL